MCEDEGKACERETEKLFAISKAKHFYSSSKSERKARSEIFESNKTNFFLVVKLDSKSKKNEKILHFSFK